MPFLKLKTKKIAQSHRKTAVAASNQKKLGTATPNTNYINVECFDSSSEDEVDKKQRIYSGKLNLETIKSDTHDESSECSDVLSVQISHVDHSQSNSNDGSEANDDDKFFNLEKKDNQSTEHFA